MPGRFLGIAWDTGDLMTFRILPDTPDKDNPYVLTRSIIEPDDGRNERCNLEQYFTKEELKKVSSQRRKG